MPAARDYLDLLLPSTWDHFARVNGPAATEQFGLLQPYNWVAATDYVGSLRTWAPTTAFRVVGFMFACVPIGRS